MREGTGAFLLPKEVVIVIDYDKLWNTYIHGLPTDKIYVPIIVECLHYCEQSPIHDEKMLYNYIKILHDYRLGTYLNENINANIIPDIYNTPNAIHFSYIDHFVECELIARAKKTYMGVKIPVYKCINIYDWANDWLTLTNYKEISKKIPNRYSFDTVFSDKDWYIEYKLHKYDRYNYREHSLIKPISSQTIRHIYPKAEHTQVNPMFIANKEINEKRMNKRNMR